MHLIRDVVDHIIDQLYDPEDYHTRGYLRATSLVSTIWVDRSQHHLFSTVSFRDSRAVKRWCCRIEPDPDGVSRHVRALTVGELFTVSTPRLAVRYIKAAVPHLASFKNLQKFALGHTELEDTSLGILAPIFSPSAGTLEQLQLTYSKATTHETWNRISALTDLSPNLTYADLSGTWEEDYCELRIRLSAGEGCRLALKHYKFHEFRTAFAIPPLLPFLESCGPHLQVLDLYALQVWEPGRG